MTLRRAREGGRAWGMTRDGTVALLLECEEERRKAKAAALEAGNPDDEARSIAHEAAKAHWNAWAEEMLKKRAALEQAGQWGAEKYSWREKARADFSRCLFLLKGDAGTIEPPGEDEEGSHADIPTVKSIVVDDRLDMRGFVFPGDASFDSAAFSGVA
jgi:hypothetical protein